MTSSGTGAADRFDLRYLKFLNGRWRWCPSAAMKQHGFALRNFAATLTEADKKLVSNLNRECDLARRGVKHKVPVRYQQGSIGWCYERALTIRAMADQQYDRVRTKEELSSDHWHRAWKWLSLLADRWPNDVTEEQLLKLQLRARKEVSDHEAYMVIKIWRALWKKMAAMKVVTLEGDPSKSFANRQPAPRRDVWTHDDVVTLVERSWAQGFYGLAAGIAVGWDSLLASGDVRDLTVNKLRHFPDGTLYFDLARAKTDAAAAGTLTEWSERIFIEYIGWLRSKGIEPKGDDPLFYNRGSSAPLPPQTLATTSVVLAVLADGPLDRAAIVKAVKAVKADTTLGQIDTALYSLKTIYKKLFANGSVYRLNPNPPPPKLRAYDPVPYNKNTFAKDFRKMKALVFGRDDNRIFHDMRRSGGIEAIAGEARIEAVGDKLANTLAASERLRQTYTPVNLVAVRAADAARLRGRALLPKEGERLKGRGLLDTRLPKLLARPDGED